MAEPHGSLGLRSVPTKAGDAEDVRPLATAPGEIGSAPIVRLGSQLSADVAVAESGIALIYRALDSLVDELHLEDAALVVDDADLGRQVFRAGRRALREDEMRLIDVPPGLYTSPPVPDASFDSSLLGSLSLIALRLDLQRLDSAHDPLTGLYTRATFTRLLETAIARTRRLGWRFALVLVDLDDLKSLNDREGHSAGDAALRAVADCFRRTLRHSDDAARIGGDEFALILPETDPDQVARLFERIEEDDDGERSVPSFSFGVATCPSDATEATELLRVADERLYAAKRRRP